MEFELDVLATVIDEQIEPSVQTKVTNEIRTLAFQLRDLIARQDLEMTIKITQDGIQYTKSEPIQSQLEIETPIEEQPIENEPVIDEQVEEPTDQANGDNSTHNLRLHSAPIVD